MSFIATAVGGLGAAALGASAGTALAAAGLGMGVGSALNAQSAQKKAASAVQNAQYQPIDLNALQEQAQNFAQQNVAKSIELEKQYMPGVAATRATLQGQISQDLARGGNLPLDVANQVTRASMAQAGGAGIGAGPLTAAQLGLSAYDLRTQAQQRANALLATNPLPTAGIDPGSLASAAIGQNQAQNQFALNKAGAMTNVYQSGANTTSNLAGNLMGAAMLMGGYGNRPSSTANVPSMLSSTGTPYTAPWMNLGSLGSNTTFSTTR